MLEHTEGFAEQRNTAGTKLRLSRLVAVFREPLAVDRSGVQTFDDQIALDQRFNV